MKACVPVEFSTPRKFRLLGLWFGPKRTRNVIVFVHGLGGSVFSMRDLVTHLVDRHTAVLVFNNRGAEIISKVRRVGSRRPMRGGMAHEVFTDCADDIQGAVQFAKRSGAKNIFLTGHSTGCQKSVYWASRKKGGRGVKGILLLAPMSDYSAHVQEYGVKKVERAVAYAWATARRGNGGQLLPPHIWDWPWSAQRFLSLYSGKGAEEIFTYWDAKKNPATLRSVKVPMLVLLAENDEYGDRPAKKIAAWFDVHNRSRLYRSVVVPKVNHGFTGAERRVANNIRAFMKEAGR